MTPEQPPAYKKAFAKIAARTAAVAKQAELDRIGICPGCTRYFGRGLWRHILKCCPEHDIRTTVSEDSNGNIP